MDNEKLKIWLGFAKFLLGTVFLGLVTTFVNNGIQNREIELKEIEQLGKFIDHALTAIALRRCGCQKEIFTLFCKGNAV